MRPTRSKKELRKIVKSILISDEKARDSDKYLYVEVIRKIKPSLLWVPLILAFTDDSLPNYETVRRNRQWIQRKFPELCGSEEIQAYREIHRQEYHDFFRKVTE